MTTTISTLAAAAREAARRNDGTFGEQNLTDPGTSVLTQTGASLPAAFLCGRCGCPVHLDRGVFVDETGGDGCDDDVHTGHRYDTPEVDELCAGDRILIDGVAATVRKVKPDPDNPDSRCLTYYPGDWVEDDSDSLDAGTRLYRLTSPALTPHPMPAGEHGVAGLICGRCGEPVIDWRGVFVDESKSTRCRSGRYAGRHTGVNAELAGCGELNEGDTLIVDGEPVVVVSLDNDNTSTSVEFRFIDSPDDTTHIRSFGNDVVFDRILSGPVLPATFIADGPDAHRFGEQHMVRAERALDGASLAGDGDDVREAAAAVNLMRARRLADRTLRGYPTAQSVVLVPAADEHGSKLQVAAIRLADGSEVARDQMPAADRNALDGEACRLDETGTDDWIRTCSESSLRHRHVMQLFDAARIDRIDVGRGTYDPIRADRS